MISRKDALRETLQRPLRGKRPWLFAAVAAVAAQRAHEGLAEGR